MSKYILRFDDITPRMNWDNFLDIKYFVEDLGVKSVLGVVPNNLDESLNVESQDRVDFWQKTQEWQKYGDTIAQHGYTHCYDSKDGGILNRNKNAEFAGNTYENQFEKLKKGKEILISHNVWQPYFMAPSHSFDTNTLKALKALDFTAITDGTGFYPYEMEGITFVPQLSVYPIDFGFGYHTICIHMNGMNKRHITKLKCFLEKNVDKFVDFKEVTEIRKHNLLYKLLRFSSVLYLNVRNLVVQFLIKILKKTLNF